MIARIDTTSVIQLKFPFITAPFECYGILLTLSLPYPTLLCCMDTSDTTGEDGLI